MCGTSQKVNLVLGCYPTTAIPPCCHHHPSPLQVIKLVAKQQLTAICITGGSCCVLALCGEGSCVYVYRAFHMNSPMHVWCHFVCVTLYTVYLLRVESPKTLWGFTWTHTMGANSSGRTALSTTPSSGTAVKLD